MFEFSQISVQSQSQSAQEEEKDDNRSAHYSVQVRKSDSWQYSAIDIENVNSLELHEDSACKAKERASNAAEESKSHNVRFEAFDKRKNSRMQAPDVGAV